MKILISIMIAAKSIQPYNALFPIPYSEIEKNVLGKLEQNPGYK
jgi:starch-binding outer membrane protein, SusD/RagB family